MKAVPLAHEQENILVGQVYQVAHAEMKQRDTGTLYTIPIIPILHSDRQLGVFEEHYHIDGRFPIHSYLKKHLRIKDGITSTVISVKSYHGLLFQKIIYKKKVCVRSTTGLTELPKKINKDGLGWNFHNDNVAAAAERYWNWYGSMLDKKCAGKKCPHLGAIMREENGELVCPLHNLHANKKTGKICWPGGQQPDVYSPAGQQPSTFDEFLKNTSQP